MHSMELRDSFVHGTRIYGVLCESCYLSSTFRKTFQFRFHNPNAGNFRFTGTTSVVPGPPPNCSLHLVSDHLLMSPELARVAQAPSFVS